MEQGIQIAGAILVLLGFALTQSGRLDGSSRSYLLINLVGSALLALAAALDRQWGFLFLNGTWAVISVVNLVRGVMGRPKSGDPRIPA